MVAGLLYIIGLAVTLVTIAMVGFSAPALLQSFMTAIEGATPDYFGALSRLGASLNWALVPLVGGLMAMAMGRIIFLLSAINRALRGVP
jgi:uncharacterized membrane protein